MTGSVYHSFLHTRQQGQKKLAVLIDPDKMNESLFDRMMTAALAAGIDYFFVGGSLVADNSAPYWIRRVKQACQVPVIIFPGSTLQVNDEADALFFLSLISGRNPDLLIGRHVEVAPLLRSLSIEVMPTGYMLIDGGAPTTVSYISNSTPIPANKPQIAACTAMAGEMLGMKIMYLDSGSGAKLPVSEAMIEQVKKCTKVPLVVGGGIRTPELAGKSCRAGADIIVVGTAFENNPELIEEMTMAVHESGQSMLA